MSAAYTSPYPIDPHAYTCQKRSTFNQMIRWFSHLWTWSTFSLYTGSTLQVKALWIPLRYSTPHHFLPVVLIMIWAEELISVLITCVGDKPAPRASPQNPPSTSLPPTHQPRTIAVVFKWAIIIRLSPRSAEALLLAQSLPREVSKVTQ